MSRPLKVLHLISSLQTGGAEMQVVSYIRELRRQGVAAGVCCIRLKGDLFEELAAEGYPCHFLKFRSRWHPLSLYELVRLIRSEGYTHIQGHMYRANVPATVVGRLAGCRQVLTTIHDYWDNNRQRWMDAALNPLRDAVLCVSEQKRQYYIEGTGIAPERCLLFPSAIDTTRLREADDTALRRELGLAPELPLVGMIARTAEPKDYRTFIDAAALVLAELPQAVFLCVGDGRQRAELEAYAAALPEPTRSRVRFLGTRHDIPEILAGLDVFVLSTKMEGLPLAILEAMAARRPVLATPVGGIPEVIEPGRTGLLFPVGESRALAEQVLGVLRRPGEFGPMLDAAAELAEREYGISGRVRSLIELYERR